MKPGSLAAMQSLQPLLKLKYKSVIMVDSNSEISGSPPEKPQFSIHQATDL